MSKFTNTFAKHYVANVVNGQGPNGILMSVTAHGISNINLVIGGKYGDKCASSVNKDGLAELITILTEIHSAMED